MCQWLLKWRGLLLAVAMAGSLIVVCSDGIRIMMILGPVRVIVKIVCGHQEHMIKASPVPF